MLAWWLVACDGPEPGSPGDEPEPTAEPLRLSGVDLAIRTSVALRGVRPSRAELDQVAADPLALDGLVDAWVESPEFIETVKDVHAELFLLRTDAVPQFPSMGLMEGWDLQEIYEATTNEPLELVARIVEGDRPYTELVTSPTIYATEALAIMYDLPWDPAGPEVQETTWSDGRPVSGILSSSKLWLRWESAGSNFHRGRANLIADKLLCDSFDTRDIVVVGGINIADEEAVAEAVLTLPTCVGCHQSLDPLAGYLWGYKYILHRNEIAAAISDGCVDVFYEGEVPALGTSYLESHYCYPLQQYTVADEDNWAELGLRAPAYFSREAEDLVDVGQMIAEDSRFAECAVRNVMAYVTQTDRNALPLATTLKLQEEFVASNYNFRKLASSIVKTPEFATYAEGHPGGSDAYSRMRVLRPEQLARTVESLTGFSWVADADALDCAEAENGRYGSLCWGPVDLMTSDNFGFRSMSGGVDGTYVVQPTHAPTPVKALVLDRLAANAAAHLVATDFALPANARLRLTLVEADTDDNQAVRAQIELLLGDFLGEPSPAPSLDEFEALWQSVRNISDPSTAWMAVISAMLQDPVLWFN